MINVRQMLDEVNYQLAGLHFYDWILASHANLNPPVMSVGIKKEISLRFYIGCMRC